MLAVGYNTYLNVSFGFVPGDFQWGNRLHFTKVKYLTIKLHHYSENGIPSTISSDIYNLNV